MKKTWQLALLIAWYPVLCFVAPLKGPSLQPRWLCSKRAAVGLVIKSNRVAGRIASLKPSHKNPSLQAGTVSDVDGRSSELHCIRADVTQVVTRVSLVALVCAYVGTAYRAVKQLVLFPSSINELVFMVFLAGSILWFSSPSALGLQTQWYMKNIACRLAARGFKRNAALAFALGPLFSAFCSIGQAVFAAELVSHAIPLHAELLLPVTPSLGKLLTSNNALAFAGPYLGSLLALPAWGIQLLTVLIKQRTLSFAMAFLAPQVCKAFIVATEPSAARMSQKGTFLYSILLFFF